MWPALAAGAVVAHGLVHASFLGRPPEVVEGPPWPFALERSWLLGRLDVPAPARRWIGRVLSVVVVGASVITGVAIVADATWWATAAVVAAVASLLQLVVWFHSWLVLGLVIDAAILLAAFGWWTPSWLPGS